MRRKGVRGLAACGLVILLAANSGCVALGAAAVGAGLGAQAGWWFGKTQKTSAEKPADPEGETHEQAK
jgi:membrane protein YqaA with SNARE-associated domain